MHWQSSLSIVKYFYIKWNSGRVLYWILLYRIPVLPSQWVVIGELKSAWRILLDLAFTIRKTTVQIHCELKKTHPTKQQNYPLSSLLGSVAMEIFFKVSSNAHHPCNSALVSAEINNLMHWVLAEQTKTAQKKDITWTLPINICLFSKWCYLIAVLIPLIFSF